MSRRVIATRRAGRKWQLYYLEDGGGAGAEVGGAVAAHLAVDLRSEFHFFLKEALKGSLKTVAL